MTNNWTPVNPDNLKKSMAYLDSVVKVRKLTQEDYDVQRQIARGEIEVPEVAR